MCETQGEVPLVDYQEIPFVAFSAQKSLQSLSWHIGFRRKKDPLKSISGDRRPSLFQIINFWCNFLFWYIWYLWSLFEGQVWWLAGSVRGPSATEAGLKHPVTEGKLEKNSQSNVFSKNTLLLAVNPRWHSVHNFFWAIVILTKGCKKNPWKFGIFDKPPSNPLPA